MNREGAARRDRAAGFTLNGRRVRLRAPAHRTLLELLREQLGLTGTKHGCETGECGACTVLLDGAPVNACLTLAARVAGRAVTTIEGLPKAHPLPAAFADAGAVQCGYCTPGMILSAKAYLDGGRRGSPAEALSGNLCRCTGYYRVLEAVRRAARGRRARRKTDG